MKNDLNLMDNELFIVISAYFFTTDPSGGQVFVRELLQLAMDELRESDFPCVRPIRGGMHENEVDGVVGLGPQKVPNGVVLISGESAIRRLAQLRLAVKQSNLLKIKTFDFTRISPIKNPAKPEIYYINSARL